MQEERKVTPAEENHVENAPYIGGINNSALVSLGLSVLSIAVNAFGLVSILGFIFALKAEGEILSTEEKGKVVALIGAIIAVISTAYSFISYSMLLHIL